MISSFSKLLKGFVAVTMSSGFFDGTNITFSSLIALFPSADSSFFEDEEQAESSNIALAATPKVTMTFPNFFLNIFFLLLMNL
ncbi:MAG: DUF3899 domain-containing protein [Lactobacillales bacterium]|nr:DUF3899 domain-containing protein [Lactobacillales bacterium]